MNIEEQVAKSLASTAHWQMYDPKTEDVFPKGRAQALITNVERQYKRLLARVEGLEHLVRLVAESQDKTSATFAQRLNELYGAESEPEPDTANAAADIAPEAPEDFYRREAERLKEQAMVHAQAAKMWQARYHDAATALERAHQESEELRRSLSRIGDLVTQEGARANERAVYGTYDAERHTR